MSKHTPGPWSAKDYRVCAFVAPNSQQPIQVICDTANNARTRTPENAANARLAAQAPAMQLALRMLCLRIARVERSGKREEFCFDGIRYSINGDWNDLFSVVGWNRALRAVAEAEGTTP